MSSSDDDGARPVGGDATTLQRLLLSTDTVQAFLDQLVHTAAVDTGHQCGITVGPKDALRQSYTVASSDEWTRRLDELQYAEGNGPCLEALRESTPVFVTDMTTEGRWPNYVEHALGLGVLSSLSYPLHNGTETVGALNFYAVEPLAPGSGLQARAGELASVAAGAVTLAQRLGQQGEAIANLKTALSSRTVIDQAIGILMAQQRCDVETAFELMRKASQGRNLKLRDVAAGIVASVQRGGTGTSPGRY